jgi:arginine decarboxylase
MVGSMSGATDPYRLRDHAPVLDAYLSFLERAPTPFTIPGHKQRTDLVGSVVSGDVPLHGGVDTVRLSGDVLGEGERRAAALWNAGWCRFSVGGSTHGNQALALAVAEPGAKVVVSRTLHRSMLLGLVLAGLEPVWVRPIIDPSTGLPGGVSPDAIAAAFERHPDARAVFVGDPSYVGGYGDIAALADVAHRHGVPLVVDAAWGAHFGFHPALPRHALAQGADALVTSAHKTLPAWSQGALVMASPSALASGRLDRNRLDRAFDATHTTSPAGAILASIDAARALLERHGTELLGQLIGVVAEARSVLAQVPGVAVLDGAWVDPTKLVVLLHDSGADGYQVEEALIARGMPLEMAERDVLIPMVTMADGASAVDALVDALSKAIAAGVGEVRPRRESLVWSIEPDMVMSPRDAFFAPHLTLTADDAVGEVCAELVAPYPPGVPVLAPGERITGEALDALRAAHADGARIAYAADPSLDTLQIVGTH